VIDSIRLVEHVHGHVGWIAAALLAHPAILLRRARRRADVSVVLAVAIPTIAGAMGVWIYDAYRDRLRQPLFASAPHVGWLFERKEHLAFGAIVLAWCGACAYFAERRAPPAIAASLRPGAHRAFAASAVLAIVAAALGTWVAATSTF